jgi:hypothetical protein
MAIKTKEEMFGDNGAFGPAVPYSTTNPPGTSAGNRGIQFGEQLTAAIANRTHYALALNDEDLNARLASFEIGGLDSSYDNGTVGPSGGGRKIIKDSGAVETISFTGAMSGDTVGDNAHFRANALSDNAGGSVGFDFLARRVGANGQSGFDAIAGLLDRRVFAKATGLTQLKALNDATLNPGGALPSTVRLSIGQFHSGGLTDLARGYDLVQISNTSGFDGLYIFSNVGGPSTDAVLENMDGSAPTFGANESCKVTVYRIRFGTFGSFTNRTRLSAAVSVGMPNAASALDVLAARNQSDTADGGADRAFRVMRKNNDGSTEEGLVIDHLGRMEQFLDRSSDIIDEVDRNVRLGGYYTWKQYVTNPGVGHVIQSYATSTLSNRYDFLSLIPIDPPVTPAITPLTGVTMKFTSNSPVTGELVFDAPQSSNLPFYLFGIGMFVEISGAGTANGLYYVAKHIDTGNQGFILRRADGSVPTHFPATGTCTLNAVYSASGIGRKVNFPNANGLSGSGATVTAYNVLSGGHEADSAALALFMPPKSLGGGTRSFIKMFAPAPGFGDNFFEAMSIDADGDIRTTGPVTSLNQITGDQMTVSGNYFITCAQTDRTINVDLRNGYPEEGDSGNPLWRFDRANNWWVLITLNSDGNAALYFPIMFTGWLMQTYVQTFSATGADNAVFAALQVTTPAWGWPSTAPTVTIGDETTISYGNGVWGEGSISHNSGSGTLINLGSNNYAIRIRGTRVGARLRALRHIVRYTRIGPGGIGG